MTAGRSRPRAVYLRDTLYYSRTVVRRPRIVAPEELTRLPAPVRRYLEYAGIVGKERAQTARIRFNGEFRMGADRKWMRVETEQTSFLDDPARVFYMKGRYLGMIPIDGRDLYARGEGHMFIKLLWLLTVADAKGPEMARSGLVTFLNDMVMIPSAFLDERIAWSAVDDRSAAATLSAGGMSVRAVLRFSDAGGVADFVTEDRFYSGKGGAFRPVRWSTPFRNYREIAGVMVPTEGDAIWHFDSGDLCYARFTLRDISYNVLE